MLKPLQVIAVLAQLGFVQVRQRRPAFLRAIKGICGAAAATLKRRALASTHLHRVDIQTDC